MRKIICLFIYFYVSLTNENVCHHLFVVVRKPPFTLSEKGWGEFDMKIKLYFTDKSVPYVTLDHDLNFNKPHYEVSHKLVRTIKFCTVTKNIHIPLYIDSN